VETAHVVAMFVGDEHSGDGFRRDTSLGQPARGLLGPQSMSRVVPDERTSVLLPPLPLARTVRETPISAGYTN